MRRVGLFQNEGLEQSEGAENLNALGNSVWQTDHPQHAYGTCMQVLSCSILHSVHCIAHCAIHMCSLWQPSGALDIF